MCSASGFLPGSAMMAFWPNHICSKFKVLSRKERSMVNAVCLLWQRQIWTMMDHASKKSGDFNGHVMSLIHLELGNKIAVHSCKLLKKQISSASVKPQMMRDGERANGSKAFKQSSQHIRQDEYTRYMRHHETILRFFMMLTHHAAPSYIRFHPAPQLGALSRSVPAAVLRVNQVLKIHFGKWSEFWSLWSRCCIYKLIFVSSVSSYRFTIDFSVRNGVVSKHLGHPLVQRSSGPHHIFCDSYVMFILQSIQVF